MMWTSELGSVQFRAALVQSLVTASKISAVEFPTPSRISWRLVRLLLVNASFSGHS